MQQNAMQKFRKQIILPCISAIAISMVLSGCTAVTSKRGNMVENHQIELISAGTSSQHDVLNTLGSPTTQSTFDVNTWYYIGQETEKHGIFDDEVVAERIIAVRFNDEGIVESINEAEEERNNIPYARAKTPTHGNDLTFMQQLLGNLGRFNTPQGSAANTAGGGL